MKRYCLDCGAPTEYSLKKPVFCSNCGNPFEKNTQVSQPVVQKVQLQKPTIAKKTYTPAVDIDEDYDIDDSDDNETITNVPNISKIQVETASENQKRGVKLKDLMGTGEGAKRNKVKIKGKKASKKQILEDFAKEAGSLRKSKR
jgi:hypothetical protein